MNLEGLGTFADARDRVRVVLRPPPKLTLSQWADRRFKLSSESSAAVGRWRTLPYQRGIMDALTDPRVMFVWFKKSARVGWTKIANAFIGFTIDQDPCPMLMVQPTIDDAKGYSKEEIAPMLRDCEFGSRVTDVKDAGPKDAGNTMTHKKFPGGVLSLTGANSGAGFRRISRKRVLLDEIDAYPASAGADGDPVKLATKRSAYYWDRKVAGGSTPLIEGLSRITQLHETGDQRLYKVPCPHCGHRDHLVFTEKETGGGHFMRWSEGKPEEAFFVCSQNGCVIEHSSKRWMVHNGHWEAQYPPGAPRPKGMADYVPGTVSFHLWAAYSYSPDADWGVIAREFLQAKREGPDKLKTFVNTVLGETWKETGEAPAWERLYHRREHYAIGTVPAGVKFLTCGVDVQKDRFVYEVVGWNERKESWSIDAGVIPEDTAKEAAYFKLDELLGRTYQAPHGPLQIVMLAIDSGYNTQMVYGWTRRHARNRVIALKGSATQKSLVGAPTDVEVLINGHKFARGAKVWPVGTDIAKGELYGWLKIDLPTKEGAELPPGFCHFPEHGEDYFKQLTGEHLVSKTTNRGFTVYEWQVIPGRENHYLDARVYARVAASVGPGLDRMAPAVPLPRVPAAHIFAPTTARLAPRQHRDRGGKSFLGNRQNWLSRK